MVYDSIWLTTTLFFNISSSIWNSTSRSVSFFLWLPYFFLKIFLLDLAHESPEVPNLFETIALFCFSIMVDFDELNFLVPAVRLSFNYRLFLIWIISLTVIWILVLWNLNKGKYIMPLSCNVLDILRLFFFFLTLYSIVLNFLGKILLYFMDLFFLLLSYLWDTYLFAWW